MANATREIIGDLRLLLNTRLRPRYPESDGARGFSHTAEAYFVKALYGIDLQDRRADYYIAPGDGGGPIVVQVGDGNDGKWKSLVSTDHKPVRVLHITTEGAVDLSQPRYTPFEEDLIQVLRQGLGKS